jgi:prepilin-type N-terminal cleavage/methylation domain-containing protein
MLHQTLHFLAPHRQQLQPADASFCVFNGSLLPRRNAGFTLMEILVAIGILAVGAIAVASIFPSAIYMQKQAVNETLGHQYIRSADAMLQGRGLRGEVLIEATDNITAGYPGTTQEEFAVYGLNHIDVSTSPAEINTGAAYADSLLARWSMFDRSFPSRVAAVVDRSYYWVPLIQRGPEASELVADWNVFAFLTRPATSGATFTDHSGSYASANVGEMTPMTSTPQVYRYPVTYSGNVLTIGAVTAGIPNVGEKILGDNGQVFKIISRNLTGTEFTVTPSPDNSFKNLEAFWFVGPDDDGNSAFADLRELSNNIVRLPPLY